MAKIVEKIQPRYYMRFKYNTYKRQEDNTDNCGFFVLLFIIKYIISQGDFKYASQYDIDQEEAQEEVDKFTWI